MKKVVFVDRDGVINEDPAGWTEHSYVTKWEYFRFLPGSIDALRMLNEAGYSIVVISNQGGISKGFYTIPELNEVNRRMLEEVFAQGARIEKVYYCVHKTEDNCGCKKPKTGLFRKAEEELGVKAAGSFFIGDGLTDVEAGINAGLRPILVMSGKTGMEDAVRSGLKPEHICRDLKAAVEYILKEENIG
ncbi:MAG: HAD-IIIA family hydrolase [Candidatus Omnitrophota bacterium]